jgi:Domain of unknown function (DUF5753)
MSTPREQLSAALKKARLAAGFDGQGKLAAAMSLSRTVIVKAESPNGAVPSDPVLVSWSKATGADLPELVELAQRAKAGVPEWFMPYLGAEQEATRLQFWEPLTVTGALKTENYCRALLSARHRKPEQLKPLVDMRMERRKVIGHARITAVLDHRVLAHAIGSTAIMAEQCGYLASLAEEQGLDLHIAPEGANIGLGGGFAIASHKGLATVCLTSTARDITSTAPDLVEEYLSTFDAVLGASLPVVQSVEYTRRREAEWKEQA